MPENRLLNIVLSLALVLMVGWLLVHGKDILLPIFTAVIVVYILNSSATALGRHRPMRWLPGWALRMIVLLGFTLGFLGIGLIFSITVEELIAVAPAYQANLENLTTRMADSFGLQSHASWTEIRGATIGRMNMQAFLGGLLSSLTSFGGSVFLVVLYAGFMFNERSTFRHKLQEIIPREREDRTIRMFADINSRIGDYLAVKTLINVILASLSYLVLWTMDVDFAAFWAVMIGLMNYIPYVGSLIGVTFPVVLSLAQFGSLATTFVLGTLLTSAQIAVGNFLDPWMVGRHVNLSPLVVMLALSVWASLWGIPGAILAIPLTSVITIICDAFPRTRFISILLAQKVPVSSREGAEP